MSRAGKKNYDSCAVREVEDIEFVYLRLNFGPAEPKKGATDTRETAGHRAILHCPVTESERVTIDSGDYRYENRTNVAAKVRRYASELICANCMFAGKTPLEVSMLRRQLAEAESNRLEAERLRLEADEAHRKAYQELMQTPPLPILPPQDIPPTGGQ